MVNFRFHLVSLVAVFLALGIGIIVGSTVIDQATVQGLERNVTSLKDQRDSARDDRARAEESLAHWRTFDGELPAELLAGRLTDVPVLVVAVDGVDTELTDRIHSWLATAASDDLGTLTLTSKVALSNDEDRSAISSILDVGDGRRETVQRAALDALARSLNPPVEAGTSTTVPAAPTTVSAAAPNAPTGGELLVRLRDAGFLTFNPPEGSDVDLATVPKPGTRVVLVSSSDAVLSNAAVMTPLAGLLAEQPGVSLVAADATPVGSDDPEFASMIRDDADLRQRVSSVDDVSEAYGQIALVLALEDLAGGVVGHYGVTADQLLPSPNR